MGFADGFIDGVLGEALADGRRVLHLGALADYIPELLNANPAALGLALLSADGKYYHTGDADAVFTIQSIAKVLSFIAAIKVLGHDEIFHKVGMEPSGETFNSLIKLEGGALRPCNPFINAGALVIVSVLANTLPFDEMLDFAGEMLGERARVNEAVYISERRSGLRNWAMAYLLSSKGMMSENVEAYLDYYFRLCAVEATAKSLAHMGLILAHNGKNPLTGRRLLGRDAAKTAKTLMLTCGMYDASGEFAIKAGLPAKSGVGGGILAAAAGFGIGAFGPALDCKGNSIGGIRAIERVSEKLGFHMFGE